jgi:hypothetical protein
MARHMKKVIFVTFYTRQMAYDRTRDLALAGTCLLADNGNGYDRMPIMIRDNDLAKAGTGLY